jgi:hypothetical protein
MFAKNYKGLIVIFLADEIAILNHISFSIIFAFFNS